MSDDLKTIRDTRTSSGADDDPEVVRVTEELARQAEAIRVAPDVAVYRRAIEAAIANWENVARAWQGVAANARQFSAGNGGIEALKAEVRAGEAIARASELRGLALLGDTIAKRLDKGDGE